MMKLNLGSRIYVAGHSGLAGSAIVRHLKAKGCDRLIVRTHAELDLTDQAAVRRFFELERPEFVFLAAAKVGGIMANSTYPAEFVHENLAIQTNVIHESWRVGVKRLLFLGSSCIYPKVCSQPIREDYLLTGPLEVTNRPYAVAKIAGIEMCWSYNRQYDTQYLAAMPTNLYGPGDNYDLKTSHVLPALIRRFHEAAHGGSSKPPSSTGPSPTVTLWGTGTPRREFLYSDDLAAACVHLLSLPDADFEGFLDAREQPPLINVGCGEDCTISELAELVASVVGFEGDIRWDTSKPDGTPRKILDVTRLESLGWRPAVALTDGIRRAYADYLTRA